MSSKTVYGLLKEARELIVKSNFSQYLQEVEELTDCAIDDLNEALKSLEADPNIYKLVRI